VLGELAVVTSPQPLLRVFEKHLLEAIGYAMQLDREYGKGDLVQPEGWYEYRPDRGPRSSPGPGKGRVSGGALLGLHAEHLDEDHLPELRMLMRSVIGYHLGGKPLASMSLFRTQEARGLPESRVHVD
jgi:DNA repair protein RecO (recombination protein O)